MREIGLPEDGEQENQEPQKIEINSFDDLPEEIGKEINGFRDKIALMVKECRLKMDAPETSEAYFLSLITYMAFQCFQLRNIMEQQEMHQMAIPELAKAIEGKVDKFSW